MRVGPYFSMTTVLLRRGKIKLEGKKGEKRQKQRRPPLNNKGRDWKDACTSQGIGTHRNWKRHGRIFLYRLPKEYSPDHIVISDL